MTTQPPAADRNTAPGNTSPGGLVLTPPEPVAPVPLDRAEPAVPIDPDAVARLDEQAGTFARTLLSIDAHSPAFASKVAAVHRLGEKEIRESASVSNRLLDKPTRAMNSGPFDQTSAVSKSLVELRRVVADLDPSRQNLDAPRKLLGVLPFGNRLRDYFASYRSSQAHLDGILRALQHGQEELRRDNAAIEQEKQNLWVAIGRLREYAYLAGRLDGELETGIAALAGADPDRAEELRRDVLFYVRQKHQDLLTQLAVGAQGYLALDLLRRNNLELIKGVDRASTTTVSALRTAVIVAQALADQKMVLDQISALNSTTEKIISGTSELLRRQSADVHRQASSATVSLRTLQQAFANIYATIDAIDDYRAAALDTMRTTVDALSTEIGRATAYLDRSAAGEIGELGSYPDGGGELTLPGGGR
ncbi:MULTISPECIES: toxic anion resistance protein [Frankia]|uniref:Toxic anion resistance n=1 Tax=Frankia casuarinae (strain DSM 45818 / CECT 9043 / HFP020203 / CcI3) TaxID=106370 RepID=Q2J8W5_FRACC|nr:MULTISPECIES: toxic anion resistance protein [Frankia]ABD12277.1 toxic anion resistance [Frankia casuarinae]